MTMPTAYSVLPERIQVKLSGKLGLDDWQTLSRARRAAIADRQLLEIDIRDIDRRFIAGVAMHINSRDDLGSLGRVSIVGCDRESAAILNWERVCMKCDTGASAACTGCPLRHASSRRQPRRS